MEILEFLSSPYSLLLTLNVDWFQPFKHVQHSVGCIYLVIQNLPIKERYKEENVILVGIMPGPHEASLTIDSYLLPMIHELQAYYSNGLSVLSHFGHEITIRLALSCISCDIPATRKVCGFLGHNARLGCNKCYKNFQVGGTQQNDFSGFDRELWEERTAKRHRDDCMKIKSCTTKTSSREMESSCGVRPCALLDLPYFDPIKLVAIDAMHNLFLGTAKHMFQVWLELELQQLAIIDDFASKFAVPNNVGRLPLKISSNHSSFKAAQWSSWTTIYSPVILHGILPSEQYKSWLLFVRACALLSQRIIRVSDVQTADHLLVLFCKSVETIYGHKYCTPNMHLHLHLKDTILDYGPLHSTWCFSFERYNGILGSLPTNKRSIEVQFMRRFIKSQRILSLSYKVNDKELVQILPTINPQDTSSLVVAHDTDVINLLQLSHGPFNSTNLYADNDYIKLLGSGTEYVFTSLEMKDLCNFYCQLHANAGKEIEYVSPFYKYYGRVSIGGDILGSLLNSKSARSSSVIAAYWPTYGSDLNNFDHSQRSIGKVQYYIQHTVTLKEMSSRTSNIVHFTLAYVHWMDYHHDNRRYGTSATVCANSVKEVSMCSFIPVLRIFAKCATCCTDLTDENVFVACPIPLKLSI